LGQILSKLSRITPPPAAAFFSGAAFFAGSELKLSQAQGKNGSALKISYLMGTGKWVAINKSFSIPSFRGKAISFWMKGKGAANNLEIKLVDEDDTNYGVKRPSLTTDGDWAQVTFTEADFSYWWGGDQSLGAVKDLYIAVAAAGDGGSGEVLISDLRLVAANPAGALAKDGLVADGSSLESWTLAKGEGANATLFSGAGLKGKAVGVQYSIPANQWVAIRKTINADLSAGNAALVLRIKGEGDPNNVEVKVVDRDESTFGKVFPGRPSRPPVREYRQSFIVPKSTLFLSSGSVTQRPWKRRATPLFVKALRAGMELRVKAPLPSL
jgi:hypothetical protein